MHQHLPRQLGTVQLQPAKPEFESGTGFVVKIVAAPLCSNWVDAVRCGRKPVKLAHIHGVQQAEQLARLPCQIRAHGSQLCPRYDTSRHRLGGYERHDEVLAEPVRFVEQQDRLRHRDMLAEGGPHHLELPCRGQEWAVLAGIGGLARHQPPPQCALNKIEHDCPVAAAKRGRHHVLDPGRRAKPPHNGVFQVAMLCSGACCARR